VVTVVIFRYTLEVSIARVLPWWAADALAWTFVLVVVLASGSLVASELRRPRSASDP